MKFRDEIILDQVSGGKGGDGCVSFRREKYIPRGGPDGGDGGDGGAVFLKSHSSLITLNKLSSQKQYIASSGDSGQRNRKSGKSGQDLIVPVPIGTNIFTYPQMEFLADLRQAEQIFCVAKGGKGGKGNQHFATSTRQAPDFSESGQSGETISLFLKLKLLANIGFLGLPNVGKSTLLNILTGQNSKTADYMFTTLQPYLGVLTHPDTGQSLTLADIPGILKGASRGLGMGLSFLKHIERVSVIAYILSIESQDLANDLEMLLSEAMHYSSQLLTKKSLIIINKADLIDFDPKWIEQESLHIENCVARYQKENLRKISSTHSDIPSSPKIIAISARNDWNLHTLKQCFFASSPKQNLDISGERPSVTS